MFRCLICGFDAELDDVAIAGPAGRCVCLPCYSREVHDEHPMPRRLRRELTAVLVVMD
jgi:hypothetical protein